MKFQYQMIRATAVAGALCAVLAGCGRDSASGSAASTPEATPAASAPAATLAVENNARPPAADAMRAATEAMAARISGKHEEIAPIAVNGNGALAMHPGRTVSSWVEFDTASLTSLDLYPAVRITGKCRENPDAGIVGLTLYSDGQRLGDRLLLTRDDRPKLVVDLKGAKTLKVEVDKGNDQLTCDWFAVGFGPSHG